MFCRQVQSHLDDYILNQIDEELIDQIDNHLKECLDCQKQLKTNRQLISTLKSITAPDPGDYYWQQMENSILSRTFGENKEESKPPNQDTAGPISIIQKYLIPLAASFILLFGSIIFSNSIINPIQSVSREVNSSSLFNMEGNSTEISNNSNSQLFMDIVATAPGSLGRHLIFANITGINGINGGSR